MRPNINSDLEATLNSLFDKDRKVVSAILTLIDSEERNRLKHQLSDQRITDKGSVEDIDLKIRTLITLCVILSDNERAQQAVSGSSQQHSVLHHIYVSLYEIARAGSLYKEDPAEEIRYLLLSAIAAMLADKHPEISPYISKASISLSSSSEDEQNLTVADLQFEIHKLLLSLVQVVRTSSDKEALITRVKECRHKLDTLQNQRFDNTVEDALRIYQISAIGNILYMVDSALVYLFTGSTNTGDSIYTILDSYSFNAIKLYRKVQDVDNENLSFLIKNLLEQFCRNSVWNIADRSPIFAEFFKRCIESTSNVLYTLLPSQRDTILDLLTVKRSIVVNMPTSAGKSLLAELYILFTLYNNASEENPPTVCYLVPTNALINQVKHRLAKAFEGLPYRVDGVLPFFEIDPIEDEILNAHHIHVLVSTPEKMDSLIRKDHNAIKNLKLVILDEAHNIGDKERGAKMELLLSIVKKRKSDARFLLLSPFVKNAQDIALWLGETDQDSLSIQYEWTPTKQYVGASQIKMNNTKLSVEYMPSGRDSLIREDLEVDIYKSSVPLKDVVEQPGVKHTEASLVLLAEKYSKLGTTLILCNGVPTTQKLALQLLSYLQKRRVSSADNERISDVIDLVRLELGNDSPLISCLPLGIAYHHSQLPVIIKEELESLIREGYIKFIYATTTLAQGMNFPITTVIFRDLTIGGGADSKKLDNSLFWNIAGRAGRAYMDMEGHVLLLHKASQPQSRIKAVARDYIKKDLLDIESSLKSFFETFNSDTQLNYALVKKDVAISSFLQYLNHLIRTSHNYDFQAVDLIKIRGMLSNSLIFNQIQIQEGFLESQEQITSFARTYVNQISGKNVGQLKLADLFGISDISLSKFYSEMSNLRQEVAEIHGDTGSEIMKASKLILDSHDSDTLSRVVEILASIPELKVFIDGRGTLDSKSIANIVIGWVNGKSIHEIARTIKRDDQSMSEVIGLCHRYINGRMKTFVPWGVSIYQNLTDDIEEDRAKNLPSYIYFGVRDNDSVILSTAGIPRFAIKEITRVYKDTYGTSALVPSNIDQVKDNIKALNYSQLNIPEMSGAAVKRIIDKYV